MQLIGSGGAVDASEGLSAELALQPCAGSTDSPPMTHLRTFRTGAALAVLLLCGSACGEIAAELDSANAQMTGPKKADDAAGDEAAAAPKQGEDWWKSATSITSKEKDPSLISCRLDGRLQFMRRDDCLARGGRTS